MRVFLLTAFTSLTLYSSGCDICGGIGSNVSAGMLLNERFHLIGLRSNNRMSTSFLDGIRHSREYLFSQELYTRYQIGKRIQLIGAIPFQTSIQRRDLGQDLFSGIGDPYGIMNAILLHKSDSTGVTRRFLSLGCGVKFPLGSYARSDKGFENLYPGTGSVDGLGMLNFVQRLKGKMTIQCDASYSLKTANSTGFKFGNTFLSSVQLTHYFSVKGNRLLYAAGAYYDHFDKSISTKSDLGLNNNSGHVGGIRLNANYLTQRWLVTAQFNIPVLQSLNSGNVKSNGALQLGIHYLLKTNIK